MHFTYARSRDGPFPLPGAFDAGAALEVVVPICSVGVVKDTLALPCRRPGDLDAMKDRAAAPA
jgi:hypothetical protein